MEKAGPDTGPAQTVDNPSPMRQKMDTYGESARGRKRSPGTSSSTAEMLILEDLYLGDVRPSERSFTRNGQYAKTLDELVKAGDMLTETLTEKQKEIFEDYMTAQREVNVLNDCETFIYSFRLAAKIMIDVLTDGQMREI